MWLTSWQEGRQQQQQHGTEKQQKQKKQKDSRPRAIRVVVQLTREDLGAPTDSTESECRIFLIFLCYCTARN